MNYQFNTDNIPDQYLYVVSFHPVIGLMYTASIVALAFALVLFGKQLIKKA